MTEKTVTIHLEDAMRLVAQTGSGHDRHGRRQR